MTEILDLKTTYGAIVAAAKERRFLTYGEIAAANDVDWNKVYRAINIHLDKLVGEATKHEWPLLTAIVVSQPNVKTGKLEGAALEGFINAARKRGYQVSDPEAFVQEQQEQVFACRRR